MRADPRGESRVGEADATDDDLAVLTHQRARAAFSGQRRFSTDEADQATALQRPQYCAAIDGFSLHANVTLRAGDKKGLRRLIRYGARQAFAQDRLNIASDGRVTYRLSRPWGPKRKTSLSFDPVTFLHRIAALIPAPYLHLTRYSGIFAPNADRRWEMTAAGIRARRRHGDIQHKAEPWLAHIPDPMPRAIPWAELLWRTFAVDVLRCPKCHARLKIIAFVTDVLVVTKILAHLKLPAMMPSPAPIVSRDQLDLDLGQYGPQHIVPIAADSARSCRDPPTG